MSIPFQFANAVWPPFQTVQPEDWLFWRPKTIDQRGSTPIAPSAVPYTQWITHAKSPVTGLG